MLIEEMSDQDLIFLIKAGSKLAEKTFYMRYSKYSEHLAGTYYSEFKDSGISYEDFFAVAFSTVHQALISYYLEKKINFYKYWKVVAKNCIYDYVRENSYTLGANALSGISLDDYRYEDNEHVIFHDIIAEREEEKGAVEVLEEYTYGDNDYFSNDEKIVAHLFFIKELKPSEILEITKWKQNRLSYLITTTRNKIKKILKENYL